MPDLELKRFTVVVSFSKVENNAAWSANTSANFASEGGVAISARTNFCTREHCKTAIKEALTQTAAKQLNVIQVASGN